MSYESAKRALDEWILRKLHGLPEPNEGSKDFDGGVHTDYQPAREPRTFVRDDLPDGCEWSDEE